ncbi:MAG: hypothetical protein SGI88_20010 [Candidatus Hydrogenedentes bacterium]|nr:hypothetical protein [Candidatus Hydrogenedentota bacterium]
MSHIPGKRLEFERDVFANHMPTYVRRAQPRTGAKVLRISAAIVLVAGVVAISAAFASGAGFLGGEKRSIERMSESFIAGLAKGDGSGALEACAESARGARLVQAEEREVFGLASTDTTGNAKDQLTALRALRAEMERIGVHWEDVRLLAFGGVRARIESEGMKDALTVLTGNVYFVSAQRIFAIEVSAWRCGPEHVIVDVWKGEAVESGVEGLARHAEQEFASMQSQAGPAQPVDVSHTKQVYVRF